MALPKIGFNEGSLLRRTLLHVGTFLVGSMAFIGIVSFVLVTIAKSVVAPKADAASDDEAETSSTTAGALASATPRAVRPHAKPNRGKRERGVPAAATTALPAKDE
ncbi:Hypothetical protein A7982_07433 [Minicystis rosea]|nr:Hypothetical protein A7982_07433 [Minicystis rosea]